MGGGGVSYVLPLRWGPGGPVTEMTAYLVSLPPWAEVLVVDGSAAAVFTEHAAAWGALVRHLRPQPWPGRNGKVAGVVTGVRHASHDTVILADDDVRYTPAQLRTVADRLTGVDLVVPQNVFSPLPWHARWDSARSLCNRAFGGDHPGTYAVRRDTFLAMGGYNGDVLFENLQLARTVAAFGGTRRDAPEVFVPRRAPSVAGFLGQRTRQAYDGFAQPPVLLWQLSWLPITVVLTKRRAWFPAAAAAAAVTVAGIGRRRGGGATAYPRSAPCWAPLWVAERAVCGWLAVLDRARGGIRYAGTRIPHATNPVTPAAPLHRGVAPPPGGPPEVSGGEGQVTDAAVGQAVRPRVAWMRRWARSPAATMATASTRCSQLSAVLRGTKFARLPIPTLRP